MLSKRLVGRMDVQSACMKSLAITELGAWFLISATLICGENKSWSLYLHDHFMIWKLHYSWLSSVHNISYFIPCRGKTWTHLDCHHALYMGIGQASRCESFWSLTYTSNTYSLLSVMILFLVCWENESSLNEESYMWSTFFILPQCSAPPTRIGGRQWKISLN